ncbi:hypothetical protein V6N13_096837 [Hibiscus sabdariffa]|uniref:UBL3-like ubiquitin domain-containing protein n=1 Tax=Hibiscus sabdariffa TaxID=183260 RepID=A0ABR2C8V6_9ROSI
MPEEDLVDIKFRLYDRSDMGPFPYSATSTVDMLKQRVASDWPKGGGFSILHFLHAFWEKNVESDDCRLLIIDEHAARRHLFLFLFLRSLLRDAPVPFYGNNV